MNDDKNKAKTLDFHHLRVGRTNIRPTIKADMEIFIIFTAISLMVVFNLIWNHYRMNKIALGRGESGICTYARSFDYRKIDTQIMREVFYAVQKWAGNYEGIPFPVRADITFIITKTLNISSINGTDIHLIRNVYHSLYDKIYPCASNFKTG